MSRPLSGRVALVAGATRGAGRGIAVALGEAGATVYCTGRSVRNRPATKGRAETIEQTAALVDRAGGRGVAWRCDHTVEAEVAALMERIRAKEGRLDVLVNDVWGSDQLIEWGAPFWQIPAVTLRTVWDRAITSHILTAQAASGLLRATAQAHGRALVVEVTDGDSMSYRGHLLYDLVKTGVIRLAWDLQQELGPHGVTALAVSPGFLRSEAMLDHFGVGPQDWRRGAEKDPDFLHSESPLFVGRAVAALAADHGVASKAGRVFGSWTLAREYGFDDADGTRPDWGAHFRSRFGDAVIPLDEGAYRTWGGWDEVKALLAR